MTSMEMVVSIAIICYTAYKIFEMKYRKNSGYKAGRKC